MFVPIDLQPDVFPDRVIADGEGGEFFEVFGISQDVP